MSLSVINARRPSRHVPGHANSTIQDVQALVTDLLPITINPKTQKTMLTSGLLPPRLTEPRNGRSVFPPDNQTDKATPQRGRLGSQAVGFPSKLR
jgi:hypothetical protein